MALDVSELALPVKPGVYLFKDSENRVLYVGKADNIRTRVRSGYKANNPDREMIPKLLEQSETVDYILVNNSTEALILERNLILEYLPKWNSKLLDGSSFPNIALTDESVPRLMYTRKAPEGATLYGPFVSARSAKKVVNLLRRQFKLRDCPTLLENGCLSMHLNLCSAPCMNADGYDDQVKAAMAVLDGDAGVLIESLQEEMDAHSKALDYERAARARDRIAAVQETLSEQIISSRFYNDVAAIGFANSGDFGIVTVLHAEGTVQSQFEYPVVHRENAAESIERALVEHYRSASPPRLLLVPEKIGQTLEKWLCEERGSKVEARVPKRGRFLKLRGLADKNAESLLKRSRHSGNLEKKAADDGARLLGLEELENIVCVDMSNAQGKHRVGAFVSLRNGRPSKKELRTYRVRKAEAEAPDDLSQMEEVVERWLRHQEDGWPSLLLLDGGELHLSRIRDLLESHGVWGRFAVAALAKREETLYVTGREPIRLDREGRVFVAARDLAHRTSNAFHRRSRSASSLRDPLEDIEGMGPKKLQSLLRHFGGHQQVKKASVEALAQAPMIGREMAKRIREHLR